MSLKCPPPLDSPMARTAAIEAILKDYELLEEVNQSTHDEYRIMNTE